MRSTLSLPRRLAVVLALVSSTPLLGACDYLRGISEPETVRVKIESSDATQVTLISSFLFSQLQDPDNPQGEPIIQLIEADTTVVQLPFEQTYPFTSRLQVYLEAYPEALSTLAMQVFIDDEVWYDDSRLIDPNALPEPLTLQFIYQFADISF